MKFGGNRSGGASAKKTREKGLITRPWQQRAKKEVLLRTGRKPLDAVEKPLKKTASEEKGEPLKRGQPVVFPSERKTRFTLTSRGGTLEHEGHAPSHCSRRKSELISLYKGRRGAIVTDPPE